MDEQMQPLPGAERIRAIQDPEGTFKAFDSYPWTKDKTFMSGLGAILGDPTSDNPQGDRLELALHARVFYYAQRVGVTIDFTQYKTWLASHPSHKPPSILPPEFSSSSPKGGSSSSVPAWQASAPKAALYVDRSAASSSGTGDQPASSTTAAGEPDYPVAFAEMLQKLQKGLPIPGIKEIPDTVIRDPTYVAPQGTETNPLLITKSRQLNP